MALPSSNTGASIRSRTDRRWEQGIEMSKVNDTLPVGARIIALMSDRNEWTAQELRRSLGLTTIQVR
ncbi:hypothetical protein [Burkholderia ubonensis]|uniref:hypothetical protein n=1 Tax=Burkholderia ubonensis TaxID=101571 RepID=UPI0012FA166C|nr:hypothetical protein [Burkholderia ubonensis]